MRLSARVVTPVVRFAISRLCRIDDRELAAVPRKGPLIIVTNHINFLDAPLLYCGLRPRSVAALVKAETWDIPGLRFLAKAWEAIPLNREATDTSAMKAALDVLAQGRILILAPEGTRSGTGQLGKGHGGVIQIAARSGAPVLPVVHFGGEAFWRNLKKPRRTRVTVRVGKPFVLALPEGGLSRSVREQSTEELMRRIARLLPESYRGVYSKGLEAEDRYLRDLPPLA